MIDQVLNPVKRSKYVTVTGHIMIYSNWSKKRRTPVLLFAGPAIIVLRKNTKKHPRRTRIVAFFDMRPR